MCTVRYRCPYLLHPTKPTEELLAQVSEVMVILLHVLLEVVLSEGQQRLLHLRVELQNTDPG